MLEKIEVVEDILKELDCNKKAQIYVFNKIDKTKKSKIRISRKKSSFVSAITGEGIDDLKKLIEKALP